MMATNQGAGTAEARSERIGWAHIALGSAGMIAVSVFYLLAPAEAVAVNPPHDLTVVRDAALADRGFLHLAGAVAVLADLLIVVGAFTVAASKRSRSQLSGIALYWLGVSTLLFIVADALAAVCLRTSAAASLPVFASTKALFDILTSAAASGCGVSAALLGWSARGAFVDGRRFLAAGMIAVGPLMAVAGAAAVWGANVGRPIGLGLTAGSVVFAAFAAWCAWDTTPDERPLQTSPHLQPSGPNDLESANALSRGAS